jgi:hypothetical protein
MVPTMRVRQADVIIEHTATGALVCDPGAGVVHRLQPPHSDYLRTASSTGHLPHDRVTLDLIELGILQSAEHHEGLTRRAVLTTAAAVGITTLTLPRAAAASSTAPAPAPTGDLFLSEDPVERKLIVYWEPVPAPFNYTWTVFNTASGSVQIATGTQAASYFDIAVYTVPSNISSVRLEVASITSPVVTETYDTTF